MPSFSRHIRDNEDKKADWRIRAAMERPRRRALHASFCRVQGGGGMSYTMTLDVPEKTADYAYRQGPRLSRELNAIFVAIIQAKMLCDDSDAESEKTAETVWPKPSETSVASRLAGVARNVVIEDDHGILARAMMEKYERISK